jgi:hypothetical protein
MGNIAVLWGQIDEALNGLLRWALKLSPEVFDQLLGTQMTGKRVDHLRAISETCSRPAVQSLMIEIHQELKNVLPRRNAVMHGCWGYFVEDPSYKSLRPGTFNHQKPKVRFFADELPKLHDDLCAVLRLLSNILMYAVEEKPETTDFNQNKIYFAPSPPDERAFPRKFERGDKVIPVASQSRGWKERPAEPRFPGEASS